MSIITNGPLCRKIVKVRLCSKFVSIAILAESRVHIVQNSISVLSKSRFKSSYARASERHTFAEARRLVAAHGVRRGYVEELLIFASFNFYIFYKFITIIIIIIIL